MRTVFLLVSLLISLFCLSPANADTCDQNKIAIQQKKVLTDFADKALKDKGSLGGITAIGMVIQRGEGTPVSLYEGVNGLGDNTAINASSIFQIGSITKSFIAVVILQLAEEDKFSIDDPKLLGKYFPEYPNWSGITLRQLMNMTSGIPGNENELPDDIFKKFTRAEYTHYISSTKLLNLTYALPVHFKPGTSFEYSNTNYILLGELIQRITHHSPEDEVKKRIIEKLGLKNTYFAIDTEQKIPGIKPSQIVHGYNTTPATSHPYSFMHFGEDITDFSLSEYGAQGAMVSTPEDINNYVHALYHPGLLLNQDQINQFTKKLVSMEDGTPFNPTKDLKDPRGFGFGIVGYYWQSQGRFLYLYNGQTDGFNFAYVYDPKTQQYLTFAVNTQGYGLVTIANLLSLLTDLNQS